jgi:hypothetical protein
MSILEVRSSVTNTVRGREPQLICGSTWTFLAEAGFRCLIALAFAPEFQRKRPAYFPDWKTKLHKYEAENFGVGFRF